MASPLFSSPALAEIYNPANELLVTATCTKQTSPLNVFGSSGYTTLQNQCSSAPQGYRHSGKSMGISIGINDFTDPSFLSICWDSPTLYDATDTSKWRIDIRHDAGKDVSEFIIVVKPYEGVGPTADKNQWITFNRALTMSDEQFAAQYDVNSQREYRMGFMALPDALGVIATFGDTTISP